MNYQALGKRIRLRRKFCKLTQNKLASSIGLSTSYLGHIERGSRKASIETITAIASALSITPNDLLQDSFDLPNRISPEVQAYTDEIRLLLEKIEHIVSG